jgi:hypothetical protein
MYTILVSHDSANFYILFCSFYLSQKKKECFFNFMTLYIRSTGSDGDTLLWDKANRIIHFPAAPTSRIGPRNPSWRFVICLCTFSMPSAAAIIYFHRLFMFCRKCIKMYPLRCFMIRNVLMYHFFNLTVNFFEYLSIFYIVQLFTNYAIKW